LEEWLEELKQMEPLTELQQMRQEMERAIASEAYERAAELRDAIRALEKSK
jgi:protein-arginine kinase activator protein McsA